MMGHYTPQLEQKTGALKDMERKLEGKDGEIDLLKKDKGEVESERDELKKQLEVADQQAENRLTSQQHHRLQRIRDSISRLEKVMAPIEAEIKNLAHDISPARDDGPQSSTEPKAQLPEEPRLSHTTSSPSIFGRWK